MSRKRDKLIPTAFRKQAPEISNRQQQGNGDALIASNLALQQNNGQGQNRNNRTDNHDIPTTQTPSSTEFEKEEYNRFHKLVWKRVVDPRINQLKPNSDEAEYIREMIRISFRVHLEEINKLTDGIGDKEQGLEQKCRALEEKISMMNKTHDDEIIEKDIKHSSDLRQAKLGYQSEVNRTRQFYEAEKKRTADNHTWNLADKDTEIRNLKARHTNEIGAFNNKVREMELERETSTLR